jgi:hypothetical protein
VAGSQRRPTSGPGQHHVRQRLLDLQVAEVEDVLDVLEHPAPHEQGTELAHLVEEAAREPVLAVELVVLHEREDDLAQPKHLVEGGALLVTGQ